jgi:MFS family permease
MFRSRPMVLSIIGIAFFTFIVAFMRSTVYMYGECQAPRWNDLETSIVVGMVAVGIGVGSPLVGYLSGGKVEVGLVPIGSIGMALAAGAAALLLADVPGLIVCIILIGLFTGFYLVPLYALLQNRAPKTSKGDWVATSNFLNVTGAMAATALFYLMFQAAIVSGLAPVLPTQDVLTGTLGPVEGERDRPKWVEVGAKRLPEVDSPGIIDPVRTSLKPGEEVKVAVYQLAGTTHYRLRAAKDVQKPIHDRRDLPSLLFLSVAVMTLLTFFALRSQLPDLFLRTLLWFRRLGRYGLEVDGMEYLPTEGPVLLTTNADNLDTCLSVLSATDRTTRFLLVEAAGDKDLSWFARRLAGRDMLAVVRASKAVDWEAVKRKAVAALAAKEVVGLPLGAAYPAEWLERLFEEADVRSAPVLPVRVEARATRHGKGRRIYLLAGEPLKRGATPEDARRAIDALAGGLKEREQRTKQAESIVAAAQVVGIRSGDEPPSSFRRG